MNSTYFSITLLAFEQLTASEKQEFMNPRLAWASTDAIRDEERVRI